MTLARTADTGNTWNRTRGQIDSSTGTSNPHDTAHDGCGWAKQHSSRKLWQPAPRTRLRLQQHIFCAAPPSAPSCVLVVVAECWRSSPLSYPHVLPLHSFLWRAGDCRYRGSRTPAPSVVSPRLCLLCPHRVSTCQQRHAFPRLCFLCATRQARRLGSHRPGMPAHRGLAVLPSLEQYFIAPTVFYVALVSLLVVVTRALFLSSASNPG